MKIVNKQSKCKMIYETVKFPLLAVFFMWMQTYFITRFAFDVGVKNMIQEFEVFVTPVASILALIGLALLVKAKYRNRVVIFISFLLSFLLASNIVFYGFYDDFITIPLLSQTSNMKDLGSSITSLLDWKVFATFIAPVLLLIINAKYKETFKARAVNWKITIPYFMSAAMIFVVTLGLAYTQRPELLTRSFDRKELVKGLGLFGYHIYDATFQVKQTTQKAFADNDQLTEVQNYLSGRKNIVNEELTGKYKDKNVIVVTLESMQTFMMDKEINGVPITPFLNELKNETYYFENHYHQTGQGKTSDSEFLIDNSMYPLGRGAVFFTNGTNTTNATPSVLKDLGYYSAVFHANDKSFWNRNVVYNNFGYDLYADVANYNVTEENSVGWGLKDKEFFAQTVEHLKTLPKPYYSRIIPLTNHYPYDLDQEDAVIDRFNSNDRTFDNYFQTVRYFDDALREFVTSLKESGIWDESIVVFYGDHYGISQNHNRAMAQFLEKESITSYDTIQLQRVPMYIHLPGQEKGKTISKVVGQIDIRPTLLNLLGATEENISFGVDVFAKEHEPFVVLRDGSFITNEYIYTNSQFYNRETGEAVEVENGEALINRAVEELSMSDKIITGDLMRFFDNAFNSKNHKLDTKIEKQPQ
ncbi:MAG: LTA synthase family protein [Bacillaceae bacterium]